MSSELEQPNLVVLYLTRARDALGNAHASASEIDKNGALAATQWQSGLNGPVRDLLFGLGTTIDSIAQMIEEGRFGDNGWGLLGKPHQFTATEQPTCQHHKWPNDSIDAICGQPKEHPIHA